jgi:PAS domain S-box-containing protein
MKIPTLTLYPVTDIPQVCTPPITTSQDKIVDSSLDVICTIDRLGYFDKVSAASFKMWGYKPQELIGIQSMTLVIEDDLLSTKKANAEIMEGLDVTNFENHFRCKDGSIIPLVWSARWDAEDEVMYCIARDAREKKHFEKQLLYNQKMLNKIQNMVKVGGWEYDFIGKQTYWISDELYAIYGVNREKVPTITAEIFKSIVHPDDLEKVTKVFSHKEALDNYVMEHRIIRPDSSIGYLRHSMELVYEENTPIRLTGVVQDITDQKVAEKLLIASERRYRTIVNNGFDMINILNEEGDYLYISDSTHRILGYEPASLIGTNAFDLVHPGDVVRIAKAFTRLYNELYVEDVEPYRFKNKNGEWRWIESKAANMLHDEAINGFVINSRDITEKKLLQEKFEKQLKEWQKKINKASIEAQEQERSQLGRELHDNVNQVLTTIKLYTELCLDGHNDNKMLLKKSATYLTNCIDEIRTISKRLSAPTLGDMSFEDSIKELVSSLKLTNQIIIDLNVDKVNKKIPKDIHLGIYRIIQEHMTNVFKHSHAEAVKININFSPTSVLLQIIDDGKGFNIKAHRNGIGISNMQARTASLDGKLKIKSAPNKGCILKLLLPL